MRGMSKVLVTGIAGFIGSTLARELMRSGVEVVGVDNLNDYYDVRLKRHRIEQLKNEFDFEFSVMDIENSTDVENLMRGNDFDVVYNLAARAGVGQSLANPKVYFTTNLLGTLNLVQSMLKHSVPKMVLASTSSVYAGEPTPFREDAPVNRPISPYAASKKAAEQLCYTFHFHYELSFTVVRYFTVFGPAGRPDMSIMRFIRWIDIGTPIELFGDGQQSRDFTDVGDIARGTAMASRSPGFEIVNLGGGRQPVSLIEVIRFIEKRLGKKAKINFRPGPQGGYPGNPS